MEPLSFTPTPSNHWLRPEVDHPRDESFAAEGHHRDLVEAVLVAPDSFKGTFTAAEVAAAMAAGLSATGANSDLCPLADGGEGTAVALVTARGGELRRAAASDPLGRRIEPDFALLDDGCTAVVEVASASGLPLLAADERDAEAASSRGTGELIAAALEAGAERVLVAAGGSATTDGGIGAIEALRERGCDCQGRLAVLCDTRHRFVEAATVFAPQKGADPQAVERLASRLERLAAGFPADPRGIAMSGAAGGLAGGLWATYGAELVPGAEFVFNALDVAARARRARWVLSGEGRVDRQSFSGKLLGSLVAICAELPRRVAVVTGGLALEEGEARQLGLAAVQTATTLAEIEAAAADCARELATLDGKGPPTG
jgi:glycerate 2-kinase